MFFALVTGLLYGRFTRPQAYVHFSRNILLSPYQDGVALMFRMATYKEKHHLTDATVVVNFAILEGTERKFQFYQLELERARVDMFNMNWTVVHPIKEGSPFHRLTQEQLKNGEMEIYVQVTGFDSVYSNQVMKRTSYTFDEIVWGAKFKPMYRESTDGNTTILELNKLNHYEKVQVKLPALA